MAHLVVNIGIQPSEIASLTGHEREALIAEFNRVNRRRK